MDNLDKNSMKLTALLVGEDGFDLGIGGANYVINRCYAEGLEQLGIIPFLAYDIRNIEEYVEFADLLCLTGGVDIHPGWYHKYYRNSAQMEGLSQSRDDLDFTLCKRFIEERKPILAIGRGMQVVNTVLGGTLCQELWEETGQNHMISYRKTEMDSEKMHMVYAGCSSILSEVCGKRFFVNSYHKQGIAVLGEGLTAAYQAEDGTIEAVIHNSLPILGIQWHPEQKDWDGMMQSDVFKVFGKWIRDDNKLLQKKEDKRQYKKKKPFVLITGGPAYDRQFYGSSLVTNKTYPSAVSAAGGVPLMPLTENAAEEYACLSDALILTGSISFVPKKEMKKRLQKEELPKRERFDEQLFWSFYRRKKPILGICLGHQMINCYLGGSLENGFKFRTGVEHMLHQHLIWTKEGSVWHHLFGKSFWVNSRHNDKISLLADALQATAWSEDGVIEAFEHKSQPIYGVEWHPERMRGDFREPPEGPDMTVLFSWFVGCSLCGTFIF